jgi:xanthine dehydrogenase molybdopterin-binding subunit B
METQATLVIPDEDGCMLVYCSTQCPSYVQQGIAACLGLPMHNICVITCRIGGGFGGKITRCLPVRLSTVPIISIQGSGLGIEDSLAMK